jgi:hypothetical protein
MIKQIEFFYKGKMYIGLVEEEYSKLKLRIKINNGKPYISVVHGYKNRNRVETLLHRYMMTPFKGFEIDHINGNSLDNSFKNLRIVTHQENMRNQARKGRVLPRGVFKHKKRLKAQITVNCKAIHLGTFDCPDLAHMKYLEARERFFGKGFKHPAKRSIDK